jgi:hypothetical protein
MRMRAGRGWSHGDDTGAAGTAGTAGARAALRSAAGVAVIAATVIASMVDFLNAGVVNVAIPAIAHRVAVVRWSIIMTRQEHT